MNSCISLSPVVSKAPIITSSPLKDQQHAGKIALLEQLQRRHHSYLKRLKRQQQKLSEVSIVETSQTIQSPPNKTTFDMESKHFASHIVARTKTKIKSYYNKKRAVSALNSTPPGGTMGAFIVNDSPSSAKIFKSTSSPAVKKTNGGHHLLPPINSSPASPAKKEKVTAPMMIPSPGTQSSSTNEYSRRLRAVQKRWQEDHHHHIQQHHTEKKPQHQHYHNLSPYLTANIHKHGTSSSLKKCTTVAARHNPMHMVPDGGSSGSTRLNKDNISIDNNITTLTRISCKRKLVFQNDHDRNCSNDAVKPNQSRLKAPGATTELSTQTALNSRTEEHVSQLRKKNYRAECKDTSLGAESNNKKKLTQEETEQVAKMRREEAEREAKMKRERLALKTAQRAQIYALNTVMKDLEQTNFASEMSSRV